MAQTRRRSRHVRFTQAEASSRSRASRRRLFEIRETRGSRERRNEDRPERAREKPRSASPRARKRRPRARVPARRARVEQRVARSESRLVLGDRRTSSTSTTRRNRLADVCDTKCFFKSSSRHAPSSPLVDARSIRDDRSRPLPPRGRYHDDRRRRSSSHDRRVRTRPRSTARPREKDVYRRHLLSVARGRGRGRRRRRLRRRLRGSLRARRLEHLLARHLPRLHVIHVGGRRRRGRGAREKQRAQPGGCDKGATRRALGRAPRTRARRRALRLAAGRADDGGGAGTGTARRGDARGGSGRGAAANCPSERVGRGVARVRRGASAAGVETIAPIECYPSSRESRGARTRRGALVPPGRGDGRADERVERDGHGVEGG